MNLLTEWIKKHPEVTAGTIRGMETDRCSVMTLDGNMENGEPSNLAMVFSGDVGDVSRGYTARQIPKKDMVINALPVLSKPVSPAEVGKKAYEERLKGQEWVTITRYLYDGCMTENLRVRVLNSAKSYARTHKLPWPIKPAAPAPGALDSPRTQDDVEPMRVAIP